MENIDIEENFEIVKSDVKAVVSTISKLTDKFDTFFKKPVLQPIDLNGDGIIDNKEKQIYDYYNNSMEKMQAHYIWGRVIDTLFTLGLVLLSIFAF